MWVVEFNDILDPVLLERFDEAVNQHCRQCGGLYVVAGDPLGNLYASDLAVKAVLDDGTIVYNDFVAAIRFASAIDFLAPIVAPAGA